MSSLSIRRKTMAVCGAACPLLLFLPAGAVFLALFVLPMAGLFVESFRLYVPGSIGSAADAPFTLANYAELLTPSFAGFFFADAAHQPAGLAGRHLAVASRSPIGSRGGCRRAGGPSRSASSSR